MLVQIYLHRWFKVCIRAAEKPGHIPFGSECWEMVTSACWWALPWRFRDLAQCRPVPSAVLAQNFSSGLFFWDLKFTEGSWVPVFLFLLTWRKIIGTGDCFEAALPSWLMLLVLILCMYEINKRPVSVTGLKLEEVLREEPVGCCSWWWLGEIRCKTLECSFLNGQVVFHEGSEINFCREEYAPHPKAETWKAVIGVFLLFNCLKPNA